MIDIDGRRRTTSADADATTTKMLINEIFHKKEKNVASITNSQFVDNIFFY